MSGASRPSACKPAVGLLMTEVGVRRKSPLSGDYGRTPKSLLCGDFSGKTELSAAGKLSRIRDGSIPETGIATHPGLRVGSTPRPGGPTRNPTPAGRKPTVASSKTTVGLRRVRKSGPRARKKDQKEAHISGGSLRLVSATRAPNQMRLGKTTAVAEPPLSPCNTGTPPLPAAPPAPPAT